MTSIPVAPQGVPAYDVVVGSGVLPRAAELVADCARVAVIHQESVAAVAGTLREHLGDARVLDIVLPDGEDAKDIGVAVRCWDALGAAGFTRSDAIIGVGGGAATDLAGFVAASWLRGVAVVQVPTTTAGMVDAAVGGKTGINTAAGKNLVGAFHQPRGVVADLDLLATLPLEHHRAGLAEVVKCGFIDDPVILDLVEADPAAALDVRAPVVAELVERAVRTKAVVVSEDAKEAGRREILNYGHTFGHAVERAEHYRWRHGDAVSVGLVFVAELARAAGVLDDATAARHRATLALLGLPTAYGGTSREELLSAMRVDKKSRADRLRFVVLHALAEPAILDDPDPALLAAAFAAVGS